MPNVQRQPRTTGRKNGHTASDIRERAHEAIARDDLQNAFAGDENNGPTGVKGAKHSTHVKSRKTKESKYRIPKR